MLSADRLSLQLYTVRGELERDFDAALARIAEIGYRQVEPFGLVEFESQLADGLAKHGLTAPTTHAGLLGRNLEPAFAAAKRLGIGTVIDPYTDPARWQSAEDVKQIAVQLNQVAHQAEDHGITIGYHNHHFELASMLDGRHALEVFVEHLAPEIVLEIDTYWAAVGGADVPALLKRLGERVVALHIKDGDGTLNNKAQVAVGSGVIPVKDFLAAAPGRLAVVELDDFEGEIFDAVSGSYAFLQQAGA
ncbi:sugar phosphate isomerase/epimerase [Kribbella sp. NBC_01245]|uniref:sugar phosphate isomerase/epimerase family protein n=1 Tax=Kribbella sp. NBC_01245 TaxID=2903578 RepID=UPI002E2DB9F0|nr:sugar phosphate isomerase/epimerase [Kribbella sp. NBC_01245]